MKILLLSINNTCSEERKSDHFGFKSKNSQPALSELENFKNDILEMIRNIKFDDNQRLQGRKFLGGYHQQMH